jgi:hypothetical protein
MSTAGPFVRARRLRWAREADILRGPVSGAIEGGPDP